MKFGDQVENYAKLGWKDKYIPYNYLKDFLHKNKYDLPKNVSLDLETPLIIDDEKTNKANAFFLECLQEKVNIVSKFFTSEANLLYQHLDFITTEIKNTEHITPITNQSNFISKQVYFQREHIAQTILKCWEYADQLKNYVQLNTIAVYRILKKRDKFLSKNDAEKEFSVFEKELSQLVISAKFTEKLISLYSESIKHKSKHPINNVNELNAIVERRLLLKYESFINLDWVSFFFGTCFMGSAIILLIIFFPCLNFNYSLFLKYFPFFRLSLVFVLLFTGAGLALACFERWNINYKFLLNIDAKCQVSSKFLFAVSQLLFTVWIIGFGVFILSIKFHLLLSETWYKVNVFIVFGTQFLLLFIPSKNLPSTDRVKVVKSILRCINSGICWKERITFTDNVVGDILTSLTKPLIDFYFVLLFIPREVLGITYKMDNYWLKFDIICIILLTAMPCYIRLCQCFSRLITDDYEKSTHLANMGKYVSSLCVVIFSQLEWGHLSSKLCLGNSLFLLICTVAAMYNFFWDIFMDWSIFEKGKLKLRSHRLYPNWVYYVIPIFDLFARWSWTITLIPFSPIQNHVTLCFFHIHFFRLFMYLSSFL